MDIQHTEYNKLIAFAADELDPSEARVVAMHTASCAECSQTVSLFQSIRRLMREDDTVEPPLRVTERAYAIFSSAAATIQHVSDSLLVAFAIDDLEPADAQKLATHINSCPECSKTVANFRAIRLLIRQDDGQDPPSATLTHAYAIFHNQRRASMPWSRWIPPLIALPSARRFAMALTLLLLILSNVLAYTSVGNLVSTAHSAIPGDSLYPVKREFEQMELVTTWDTAGKLDKHIAFAGYRIDETAALISIQRLVEIPATLAAFETETNSVVQAYNVLVKENASRAQAFGTKVQDAFSGYSIKLANLHDAAGDAVKPFIDHAIVTSASNQQIVRDVIDQLLTQPNTPVLVTLTPTDVARPLATSVLPSLTGIPIPRVTSTPAPPLQNTPINIAPTSTSVVVNTAAPTPPGIVPTTTQTPTPILIVPTATRTSTPTVIVPTATRTPTPTIIVPTATRTSTPTVIVPTATRTPTPTPEKTKIPPGQLTKTLTPVP